MLYIYIKQLYKEKKNILHKGYYDFIQNVSFKKKENFIVKEE